MRSGVRADIRDGREQLLPSKGRIQMSKTNYLQAVISDLQRTAGPYRCAMCGRLRVGKDFLHGARWSVQPCVRPVSAVHMTAYPGSIPDVASNT